MDALIEAVVGILPNADWAKIVGLLIIVFGGWVWAGRFKLEWIGYLCRHVVRWLRCKIRRRHIWQSNRALRIVGAPPSATTYVCVVCGARRTVIE